VSILPHASWSFAALIVLAALFVIGLAIFAAVEIVRARRSAWRRLRQARMAYGPRKPHHSTKRNGTQAVP
jgi:hypothetical protein